MDTKIYKIVPFSEVLIGQEFDEPSYCDEVCSSDPWVKTEVNSYKAKKGNTNWHDGDSEFKSGCLVRIADCKPELDFDTWWKTIGQSAGFTYCGGNVERGGRAAWEAAKAN